MTEATTRNAGTKHMLSERRRKVQDEVHRRIRNVQGHRLKDVRDDLEQADIHNHEDMELALLRMRVETLSRLEEALVRLETGDYGSCVDCDDKLTEQRLLALPFAVRCRACEERREHVQGHAWESGQRRSSLSSLSDTVTS